MEWVVFFMLLLMYGFKFILFAQSILKEPFVPYSLPYNTETLQQEQLNRNINQLYAQKSTMSKPEKVDWKKEGF